MPLDNIGKLRIALYDILDYACHDEGCEESMTEFCTCGLREAYKDARRVLKETE